MQKPEDQARENDRGNLGDQTLKEFQQFVTPDDGLALCELSEACATRSVNRLLSLLLC